VRALAAVAELTLAVPSAVVEAGQSGRGGDRSRMARRKLDQQLQRRADDGHGGQDVRVIVRLKPGARALAAQKLQRRNGRLRQAFALVDAVSADLPASQIARFAEDDDVLSVSSDAVVMSDGVASSSGVRVQNGLAGAWMLLRFDNLFGPDPNQIPMGSTITSVTLNVHHNSDGATTGSAALRRMHADLSAASTWLSLLTSGPGLQFDGVEASSANATVSNLAAISAKTFSGSGFTSTVQAWANGDPNRGWALWQSSALNPLAPVGTPWRWSPVTESTTIDGQNIVWGENVVSGENIVWGENVVWGESAGWGDTVTCGECEEQ
jgi:hypothetical protein